MRILKRLYTDRHGSTAVEYGLIAALIAVAIYAALEVTAETTKTKFNNVEASLSDSDPTGPIGGGSGGSSGSGGDATHRPALPRRLGRITGA